jgi:hypothetical protein
MAWTGITQLIGKKSMTICPNGGSTFWTNCFPFDQDLDGNPTKEWKNVVKDKDMITNILLSKSFADNVVLIDIKKFESNGNVVNVSDISNCVTAKCVMKKDPRGFMLLVVGNKTAKTQLLCGRTKRDASFSPLLVYVKDKKFHLLNEV